MASDGFQTLLYISFLLSLALLIFPSESLNCTKQSFKNNKLYQNCTDLPVLNSFLHYTYDPRYPSLSIAFVAPPAEPEGWVAWGINPTGLRMIGSQALVAFTSNGSLLVNTYNISNFAPPQVSNLSFDVWDTSAEWYEGNMVIFATISLPGNAERLNQVWQVGSGVKDNSPLQHEMNADNMNSKGTLELVAASTPAPAYEPSINRSEIRRIEIWNLGSIIGLFILIGSFVAL